MKREKLIKWLKEIYSDLPHKPYDAESSILSLLEELGVEIKVDLYGDRYIEEDK